MSLQFGLLTPASLPIPRRPLAIHPPPSPVKVTPRDKRTRRSSYVSSRRHRSCLNYIRRIHGDGKQHDSPRVSDYQRLNSKLRFNCALQDKQASPSNGSSPGKSPLLIEIPLRINGFVPINRSASNSCPRTRCSSTVLSASPVEITPPAPDTISAASPFSDPTTMSFDRGVLDSQSPSPKASCSIDKLDNIGHLLYLAEGLHQTTCFREGSMNFDTQHSDAKEDGSQKLILNFMNSRQTSLIVADAANICLALPEFRGLSWRKDAERLENLSEDAAFASRVRSVKFNLGHSYPKQAKRIALSFLLRNELHPDYRSALCARDWGRYATDLEAGKPTPVLTAKALRRALMRLPNLDSLHLTWTECPWENGSSEIGELFDPRASIQLAGSEITRTQQWVLHALGNSDIHLSRLILEPFVVSDLVIPSSLDPGATMNFESITELGLEIIHTEELFRQDKLEYFLSLMPNLTELRIHAVPGGQGPSFTDFLPRTYLPHLQRLDLGNLHFRLESFASFLLAHSCTIRELSLSNLNGLSSSMNPSAADWDGIFRLIRGECHELRHVFVDGIFRQNGAGTRRFYHTTDSIAMLDNDPSSMCAEAMEKFLLEGGRYPQP